MPSIIPKMRQVNLDSMVDRSSLVARMRGRIPHAAVNRFGHRLRLWFVHACAFQPLRNR